mmetsp:Transcript_13180/g.30429  ORF Transcript_13180/g.30429 Transcript_13180/m.30429 type:complete len:86 (+) Transcript_13180:518-775(+)
MHVATLRAHPHSARRRAPRAISSSPQVALTALGRLYPVLTHLFTNGLYGAIHIDAFRRQSGFYARLNLFEVHRLYTIHIFVHSLP